MFADFALSLLRSESLWLPVLFLPLIVIEEEFGWLLRRRITCLGSQTDDDVAAVAAVGTIIMFVCFVVWCSLFIVWSFVTGYAGKSVGVVLCSVKDKKLWNSSRILPHIDKEKHAHVVKPCQCNRIFSAGDLCLSSFLDCDVMSKRSHSPREWKDSFERHNSWSHIFELFKVISI